MISANISLICAAAENMAIGITGHMPWHISEDFRYFKRVTSGHTVIMGRRTWDSLPKKPLPERRNIVISTKPASVEDLSSGAEFFNSLDMALSSASSENEIFIIGGGSLYRQTIDRAQRIYLTEVHTKIESADTFFPRIDPDIWKEFSRSEKYTDDRSGLSFEFVVYERR